MQAAKKYIERSLDYFHADNQPLVGKSIIILDQPSKELFQQSQSGTMSLYDRLSDIGVTFVDTENNENTNDMGHFIALKFGKDSFKIATELFQKIPLPLGEANFNYPVFRSVVYQLLCASYTYHHDKTVGKVAVIDADSFAPLDARNLSKINNKSAMPISLKGAIHIDQGEKRYSKLVLFDFQFFEAISKPAIVSETAETTTFSISISINYCFKEINSQKYADNLAKEVLARLESITNENIWTDNWSQTDHSSNSYNTGSTLEHVIDQFDSQLERLCFLACPILDNISVDNCPIPPKLECSESHRQLQQNLLGSLLNYAHLNALLTNTMAFIKNKPTITLCLNLKHFHSFQKKNFSISKLEECQKLASLEDSYFFIPFESKLFGVKVRTNELSKLAPLIPNPLNDWGFQGSQAHYLWRVNEEFSHPLFFPTVGKNHAEEFRKNITALTSLLPAEQAIQDLLQPRQTILGASQEGLKYGVAAGILDEIADRTGLLNSFCRSFVYSVTRGYLFGQIPGSILSAAGSAYCQWIEPGISDSKLKTFLGFTAPKGFLLATAVQNPLGTACALIGYQASRMVIQKLCPGQQPAEQIEEPDHKRRIHSPQSKRLRHTPKKAKKSRRR